MKRLAAVAGLLVLAAGILLVRLGSSNQAHATLSKTLTIDAVGRDQFAPAPTDAKPALTSDQAIAAFQKQDPEFVLSDDATVTLGLYTASNGNGSYSSNNTLAYGLNYRFCIPSFNPNLPAQQAPSCNFWLFLDANTGDMLEGVQGSSTAVVG